MPTLPKSIRFIVPKSGNKKYIAILPDGRRVAFGDRRYQHYADKVPVRLGGGKWKKKDHKDAKRRANYRARHRSVMKGRKPAYQVRYTPAWFSWYFLW